MGSFSSERLPIPDVILIRVRKFADSRGHFLETFRKSDFAEISIGCEFVQDNQAFSAQAGTIRGLHFQVPPHAQAKLVRVLHGAVYDAAVDLRRGSPTYGKWCGARLTAAGGEQIFVPRGFAHGYCTLEADTVVAYKVDNYYAPQSEAGLIWNDPEIGIDWTIPASRVLVSDKDSKLPSLRTFDTPFTGEA
ncbi:MAG: dTDP-4-dehydrorhamnose 3,5-epimerase [Methylobacteriaceae bacterium]|jgi:dTDP-4-dehydrorhamnose 3,5-epimerase|nr:dTDP-4-dehydrorhamnose 3,5-epimerase [Methylobacteriaceae bacterium]